MVHMTDDMGFYDTQVHNPHSTPTPHFGALARAGIVLSRHHSFKYCSPTRRSFMSGRFPTLISQQQAAVCSNLLPLEFTLVSEKLQQAGYQAHFIGKGHLGYQTVDHLPINRGFDSHVGYFHGQEDYANASNRASRQGGARDMWQDGHPGDVIAGEIHYSTNFYTTRAVQLLEARNTSRPFFLHMPWQAVHAPCTRHHTTH